jgi:hypothetical protein
MRYEAPQWWLSSGDRRAPDAEAIVVVPRFPRRSRSAPDPYRLENGRTIPIASEHPGHPAPAAPAIPNPHLPWQQLDAATA